MSFIDCIMKNDRLKQSQKDNLIAEYDRLVERLTDKYGTNAPLIGAQKYVGLKAAEITKKNENTVRDVLAWRGIDRRVKTAAAAYAKDKAEAGRIFGRLWGKSSYAAGARSFLENVYTRQQAIERRVTLAIGQEIETFRSKHAGLTQDVEGFTRVVEHLLGKDSGNEETRVFAKAIRAQFDNLHKMYTQAGGILGRLENYFPQRHNPELVGRVPFKEWFDYITPLGDRAKIVDEITGLPLTDGEYVKAMLDMYNGIRTNGLDEVAEKAAKGGQRIGRGGGVATRRDMSRFFHFKNADAFLQYNARFGYGEAGLFDAMLGHISTMARDIGAMQEMGPKPEATIGRLLLGTQADGAGPQAGRTLQGMYDTLAGRNGYSGELPGWYKAVSNVQHWLRSSLLGGAVVSSLNDSFYVGFTARMNGLPVSRALGDFAKLLNPLSDADRRIARRIAFVTQVANGHSIAQARFHDDLGGPGISSWLANFTHRASGFATETDAVRQSVIVSTQGFFAEAKAMETAFADLHPNMKAALKRWGMNETDYKTIVGSTPHVEDGGADFIRPEDVALRSPETARKYEMWLVDMAQDASNEPRLLTRAIATGAVMGEARQGTFPRALASSLMMFKSFGVTVMMQHLLPALRYAATAQGLDRLSRIAPMLIGTTVLGGLAMQAKDVLYGRTPRAMDSRDFWMQAMMQGGGFGIFGDFVLDDTSRFGQNWAVTAAGPVLGFANDAYRVFQGNFDRSLDKGTHTKFLADLSQFTSRYMPGVKLWYTRLLLERLLLDQAQRMADPLYDTRIRRIESKMRHDREQQFWWAPGEALPRQP